MIQYYYLYLPNFLPFYIKISSFIIFLKNIRYFDDKFIITGHTPTQNIKDNDNPGYIYINKNNIDIDCGATYGERLGCLRLDDMKEYYVDMK